MAVRPTSSPAGRVATSVNGALAAAPTRSRSMAGTATWTLPLSSSAPHGRWQIAAYIDPKSRSGRPRAVRRRRFRAAAAEGDADAGDAGRCTPATTIHVRAESRFLYGAPASGLSGEGEARITADGNPFPGFAAISSAASTTLSPMSTSR